MTQVVTRTSMGDGVYKLQLESPARGNALGGENVQALTSAFDDCLGASARLILLAGSGKHFCTGFDLSTLDSESDASLLLRFVNIEILLQAVHRSHVPTMAVGRGRCYGAGADLFCACDTRAAFVDAHFAFPGPGFGLVLGSSRLASIIGKDAARDVLLSGKVLSAQEALNLGLATHLVESEEQLETLIQAQAAKARRLDPATVSALHQATNTADYDLDLANLVRSASRPGIAGRIRNYLATLKANSR